MTEGIKVLSDDGKEYLTDTMDCLAEAVAMMRRQPTSRIAKRAPAARAGRRLAFCQELTDLHLDPARCRLFELGHM
jgi:hypothetical protein